MSDDCEDTQEEEAVLELSLVLKEKKVRLKDERGVKTDYIIRELSGPDRDKYQSFLSARLKPDNKGRPTNHDQTGMVARLIAMHLWEADGVKGIPESVIKGWPSSTQQALAKVCVELSALGPDAEEQQKNS